MSFEKTYILQPRADVGMGIKSSWTVGRMTCRYHGYKMTKTHPANSDPRSLACVLYPTFMGFKGDGVGEGLKVNFSAQWVCAWRRRELGLENLA
jgi:hypothetical protein